MASFTSYTTTRGKPSFPHAGNSRNFERNSSINNDHVNRLYNWQQRMEQKKKMLKQKFVKENTPSFTPTKYSGKAGTSAVGKPQRAHTPTESSAMQKHRERLSRARKKEKEKHQVHIHGKRWTGKTTKPKAPVLSYQTRPPKKTNAPSAKNTSKVNSYSSMYKTKTSVQQEPIPSISPTQSSLSKQAAASIASAMGDVKKKRIPVGAVPIVKQNSPTSAGYKNVSGDGYGSYFMQHQLQKMEHEQVEAYQQAAISISIHGGEGFSGAKTFSDRQTGSNELEKGFIGSRETISSTHALAHNYSETIPQYNRQLSPEFKPEKYNDYYDEKNYVYQPIVLPSPPKTEIVAVGLENDNAFANKRPLDWEYVQRKTKFLTDRAKEKSDQLEWRLKQLEFENKKLLGLIPADQNLESEDQTNAVKRTKSELNSLKGHYQRMSKAAIIQTTRSGKEHVSTMGTAKRM